MARPKPDKLSVDQLLKLVEQLSPEEQFDLRRKLGIRSATDALQATHELADREAESWLDADLGANFDAYKWSAMPVGKPVQYVRNVGFMVAEEPA